MPKQIYYPYIVLVFVGVAVIGLGAAAAEREAVISLCLPGLLTGLAMILLAVNRLLYLRAANAVILNEKAQLRTMCPIAVGFGLIYMSIDDLVGL
jgi:hypothetical protein